MKKVIVNKIDGYDYYLIDSNNKTYVKNIEFICEYKPRVNDIIYLSENILNEENIYIFTEEIDNKIKEEDVIKVVSKDNDHYYIRQYG